MDMLFSSASSISGKSASSSFRNEAALFVITDSGWPGGNHDTNSSVVCQ